MDFSKRGELILATRAPKSDAEKLADGSPSFACYKIEGKPKGKLKRKAQDEPPGTSRGSRCQSDGGTIGRARRVVRRSRVCVEGDEE